MDNRFPDVGQVAHARVGEIVLVPGTLGGAPADFGLLIYGSQESCPRDYAPAFTHGSWVTLEDLGQMDVTAVQADAAEHLQRRFLREGVTDTSRYREVVAPVPSFAPNPSYQDQAKALLAGHR